MASQSLTTFKNLAQTFTDIPLQLHQILDEMRNGKLRIEFEHVTSNA